MRIIYRGSMDLLERITIDPAVRFGKPCVRGTRLTVGDVLGTLASGCSEAELLDDFPQLCHEDVLACLAFAAERERRLLVWSHYRDNRNSWDGRLDESGMCCIASCRCQH